MKRKILLPALLSVLLTGCSLLPDSSGIPPATEKVRTETTECTSIVSLPPPETTTVTVPTVTEKTAPETSVSPETTAPAPKGKTVYDELYADISNFKTRITLKRKIDTEEISFAMQRLEWEHPEIFWINGYSMQYNDTSAEITLKVMNQYDEPTLRQMSQVLHQAVKDILQTLSPGLSDYEKALQIHDYLVSHTEYDSASVNLGKGLWSTAYGCLINGRAVCQGYSQAYQLLMTQCGVECGICSGDAGDEPHAWNYIRIDGDYYWTDVTWDDPVSAENAPSDWIHHSYFLINSDMLLRTRTFNDTKQFVPYCCTLEKNYFYQNGNYLDTYYFSEIDALLTAHQAEGKVEVMFSSLEDYQMAITDLFDNETIWNAQIFQATGGSINYQTDEDMYVLRLVFHVN